MLVPVAFVPVFPSYWLPRQMRLFHGLEILADSFAHVWVLLVLAFLDASGALRTRVW